MLEREMQLLKESIENHRAMYKLLEMHRNILWAFLQHVIHCKDVKTCCESAAANAMERMVEYGIPGLKDPGKGGGK